MTLTFRNIDADPRDPVEQWGFEGILAALDRGSLRDWRRLGAAVEREPWGGVAQRLVDALACAEDSGVVGLMTQVLADARKRAEDVERQAVVSRVRAAVERSGMSRSEFAASIGTSASRLSTYLNGRVVPSAAMLVRIESRP